MVETAFLARASDQAQTIKLADVLSNMPSIAIRDPKFAKVYLPEMQDLVGVLTRGDKTLWNRAAEDLDSLGYPVKGYK